MTYFDTPLSERSDTSAGGTVLKRAARKFFHFGSGNGDASSVGEEQESNDAPSTKQESARRSPNATSGRRASASKTATSLPNAAKKQKQSTVSGRVNADGTGEAPRAIGDGEVASTNTGAYIGGGLYYVVLGFLVPS